MRFFALLLIFALSACAQPWPSSAFRPANPEFYADLPEDYPLKGKVELGEAVNRLDAESPIRGEAYRQALHAVFSKAGLLASNAAPYSLSADILDYRVLDVGFFHLEAGAAVAYTLTSASGQTVQRFTVTSTQDERKHLLDDNAIVQQRAMAVALGENAAQALRQLALLKPADIGQEPSASKPVRKGKKK